MPRTARDLPEEKEIILFSLKGTKLRRVAFRWGRLLVAESTEIGQYAAKAL
jgi:hypothetical protein